jgi:hypothetical protein
VYDYRKAVAEAEAHAARAEELAEEAARANAAGASAATVRRLRALAAIEETEAARGEYVLLPENVQIAPPCSVVNLPI